MQGYLGDIGPNNGKWNGKGHGKLNGHWDHVLIYGDVGFPKLETPFCWVGFPQQVLESIGVYVGPYIGVFHMSWSLGLRVWGLGLVVSVSKASFSPIP